jgi:hypothetical protein
LDLSQANTTSVCVIRRIQRTWSAFLSITQVSRLILFENMPSALCHCMISKTSNIIVTWFYTIRRYYTSWRPLYSRLHLR